MGNCFNKYEIKQGSVNIRKWFDHPMFTKFPSPIYSAAIIDNKLQFRLFKNQNNEKTRNSIIKQLAQWDQLSPMLIRQSVQFVSVSPPSPFAEIQ